MNLYLWILWLTGRKGAAKNKWIPISKVTHKIQNGECWVMYNGSITMAYLDVWGWYKYYPCDLTSLSKHHITHVYFIKKPKRPVTPDQSKKGKIK